MRDAERVPVDDPHVQPRWFACYTRARHEKRVATTLDQQGMESFLPLVLRDSEADNVPVTEDVVPAQAAVA